MLPNSGASTHDASATTNAPSERRSGTNGADPVGGLETAAGGFETTVGVFHRVGGFKPAYSRELTVALRTGTTTRCPAAS